jgi:cell division septal protein FtsQ
MRRSTGRGARSRAAAGLARVERNAQARRRRALAHLERMHGRSAATRAESGPGPLRVGALVLAGSLALGLLMSSGWGARATLTGVSVGGTRQLAPLDVARASGLAPGTPLAEIRPEEIASRLAEHPWIRGARALLLPTGRLLLEVDEREVVAVLDAPQPLAIDAEGSAFAAVPPGQLDQLPRVVAASGAKNAGAAEADLSDAALLLALLPEHGLPAPLEIRVAAPDDAEGLSLRLPDLTPRVVLGRDSFDAKLAELARLVAAELPELARATRLDLRFEDQAVLDGPDVSPPPKEAAQAAAVPGRAPSSKPRPTG